MTETFFSNGRQLTWEYPRATPQGDQVVAQENGIGQPGQALDHAGAARDQ
jgi:hypothetical protein